MSVTEKLDEYGITCSPGECKVTCPECREETFSVMKNDKFGKCWRGSCEFKIYAGNTVNGEEHSRNLHEMYSIAEGFVQACQSCLNDLISKKLRRLYCAQGRLSETEKSCIYLLKERGIHPDVLIDLGVGIVPEVSEKMNMFECMFDNLIKSMEDSFKEKKEEKKGPGRPRKAEKNLIEIDLEMARTAREKFKKFINDYRGWIIFPYQDTSGNILSIRFRQANSKNFAFYKPFPGVGVFGEPIRHQYGIYPDELKPLEIHTIITEGEFNTLQLQSAIKRQAKKDLPYARVYSVGGIYNADIKTIVKLSGIPPMVCYDNDSSGAGYKLVQAIALARAVDACTTPGYESDLDSYIRSFGDNHDAALQAIVKQILNSKRVYRPYDAVKDEVDQVRRSFRKKTFEIDREVFEIIREDLIQRGQFHHDDRDAYYFNDEQKRLIKIEAGGHEWKMFLPKYGLCSTESIFKSVTEELFRYAFLHPHNSAVHIFSHFNVDTSTLYVYNHGQLVYHISKDGWGRFNNGKDGVLFREDVSEKIFHAKQGENMPTKLLDMLIIDRINFSEGKLTRNEQCILFKMWLRSLFFASLFHTRPIVAILGERGSGKTTIGKAVGRLLFGPEFNVTPLSNGQKDFDASVTNNHLTIIDNVDASDNKNSWLENRLATAATGGKIEMRRLYSNNELVSYPIRSFLVLTSRDPDFNREDVADRLLIFNVERIQDFMSEHVLMQEIDSNRDHLMWELLQDLQQVVKALDEQKDKTFSTDFRMADFASFALKVAYGQGQMQGDQMKDILWKLSQTQSAFVLGDNPIIELITQWLNLDGGKNVGRELTPSALYDELHKLMSASEFCSYFGYENSRGFAQKWSRTKITLETHFNIMERTGASRKKLISIYPLSVKTPEEGSNTL